MSSNRLQESSAECIGLLSELDASLLRLARLDQVQSAGEWKRGERNVGRIVRLTDDRPIGLDVPLTGQFAGLRCFCKADIVGLHREGYPIWDVMESTGLAITAAPKPLSTGTGYHSIIHARIYACGLNHRVVWPVLTSMTACAELLELGTKAGITNESAATE